MSEPPVTIEARKLAAYVPVQVIDADARLVRCPSPGCGDTAHVEDDGRIACPTGDMINTYLADVLTDLEQRGLIP